MLHGHTNQPWLVKKPTLVVVHQTTKIVAPREHVAPAHPRHIRTKHPLWSFANLDGIPLKNHSQITSDPVMLRNSGQPLIKKELQAIVIYSNRKGPSSQIRPLVPNCLDQTNEFALVRGQLGMLLCHGSTKKCDRSLAVVNSTKTSPGSITIHDKYLIKIR